MPYRATGRPPGRPKKRPSRNGEKPRLTDAQWKGAEFEFQHLEDWRKPFRASLSEVAKCAGVSRQAVHKWRRDPEYLRGVTWLATQTITAALAAEKQAERDRFAMLRDKRQRDAWIGMRVNRDWTGPVESPFDGKVYEIAEAYAEHLSKHDAVHAEDVKALRKKGFG